MTQALQKCKVAVIGCGPVGILASLLLQHLNIQYISVQRHKSPRSHPSAHWLNSYSKSILSQIPDLAQSVDAHQEKWDYFRYYRYVEHLFGYQLGITDHFRPSVKERIDSSVGLFGQMANHIPQNLLLQLMYEKIKNKQRLIFDKDIQYIQPTTTTTTTPNNQQYILYDQHNNPIIQTKYLILSSGANSPIRTKLGLTKFHMQGKNNLMDIINIHFTSKQLANKLKQHDHHAMLHFIYGRKIIGILVNHSIDRTGSFVLQVPNYQPFVDLLAVYSARDLISMMFQDQDYARGITDLNVIHVGKWKLQGVLADSMYKNGIFLAGDAAHAYPPAGGFGMNSGFQDIHELVHSLHMQIKNQKVDGDRLFHTYSQNRRKINSQYLSKALQNYEITKNISISLGYSPNILDYFAKSSILNSLLKWMPKNKNSIKLMQQARLQAMKLMYRRHHITNPGLQLFFDQFDYSLQNISKINRHIINDVKNLGRNVPNLYARQGQVTLEQIKDKFGDVENSNILFYDPSLAQFKSAQKLISSSGHVIIK